MQPTKRVLQAIAVTAELTGTQLSKAAAQVMASDLARYPEVQVLGALDRCRKELRSRLTVADVITRLDDGRPGPEEAWAMVPTTEGASVVWTDEMREAFFVAYPLIEEGDMVAARMAFLEHYRKSMQAARDAGKAVAWQLSPGYDKDGRERAILDAAEKGRLSVEAARALLPHHNSDFGDRLLALAGGIKRLEEQT